MKFCWAFLNKWPMVPGGQPQEYQPWGEATDRHLYSLLGFFFFFTYFAKSSKSVAKDSAIKYQREYL